MVVECQILRAAEEKQRLYPRSWATSILSADSLCWWKQHHPNQKHRTKRSSKWKSAFMKILQMRIACQTVCPMSVEACGWWKRKKRRRDRSKRDDDDSWGPRRMARWDLQATKILKRNIVGRKICRRRIPELHESIVIVGFSIKRG